MLNLLVKIYNYKTLFRYSKSENSIRFHGQKLRTASGLDCGFKCRFAFVAGHLRGCHAIQYGDVYTA